MDWNTMGITWTRIAVAMRHGANASNDVVIGHVESPQVDPSNMDAVIKHFGPTRVASWLNHSSTFDVRARAWFKARYKQSRDVIRMDVEDMRKAIHDAVLMGTATRGARVAKTVLRIAIGPFTRIIESGEVVEYDAIFRDALAALVDANFPADVAREFVSQSLAAIGISPTDETEDENETDENE